ncbi:MAG: TolC family protein [Desulfovermiculus sp.]
MLQKKKFLIRTFIICFVILVWAGSGLCAQQTELLDLRLGMHNGASRAVLACRGPRPLEMGPLSNSTYTISFNSLSLDSDWNALDIPSESCLTQVASRTGASEQSIVLHTSHTDLWVEEVVLKNDHRPGHYRLVLDFWPGTEIQSPADTSPADASMSQKSQDRGTKPKPIDSLPQGQHRPVRTDLVLESTAENLKSTAPEVQAASIYGFRVGEHSKFTRVVVEARGQEPTSITKVNNATVHIGFQKFDLQVPERVMHQKLKGLIRDLRIGEQGLDLELKPGARTRQTVILDTDPPRPGAYRLVLDFIEPAEEKNTPEESSQSALPQKSKSETHQPGHTQNSAVHKEGQKRPGSTVRTVSIGCIQGGAGPEVIEIASKAIAELRDLFGADQVHIVSPQEWKIDWDLERTQAVLASAARDSKLDIIWAFGPLAVLAASRLNVHPSMPVMGMSLLNLSQILPEITQVQDRAQENVILIRERGRVKLDVEYMQRLFDPQKIRILVPGGLLQSEPRVEAALVRLGQSLNCELIVHGMCDAQSFLEHVQGRAPVYAAPGLDLSLPERKRLFQGLTKKKIPSFSAAGYTDVQAGALAGARPRMRVQLARRMALNTRELLSGEAPQDVPQDVDSVDRLCINARTAREMGWDIGLNISLEAEILHPEDAQNTPDQLPLLSMQQAMHRAAQTYPDIESMKAEAESARARVGQAAGGLWPQIEGSVQSRRIDADRAEASLGLVPEARTSGHISLRQVIFDDSVISAFRSSRHAARYKELEAEAEALDGMHRAGRRYRAVLQAQAMGRIERQNLELIQDNLHLARVRRRAGYSGPEDVLRWQTQKTRQQKRVLQAESNLEKAWVALNQAMGVDQDTRWNLQEGPGQDKIASCVHQGMSSVMTSSHKKEQVADFVFRVARQNSPELAALKEGLKSAHIELGKRKRSVYVPKVGLALEFEQVFDEDRPEVRLSDPGQPPEYQPVFAGIESKMQALSETRDQQEWSAAVNLSLPLFQGGRRAYEIQESQAELRTLRSRQKKARQLTEQQVRSAVHSLSASLPGLRLSRKAREQSQKNLEIIQKKYAKGQIPILDLLNAQKEWHVQEQRHILARSTYARDLLDLQRAMSWMEWTKTDAEKSEWVRGLHKEVEAED